MRSFARRLGQLTEFIAAMLMAAMFIVFIVQITIRYTARLEWLAEALPWLDPNLYGWTLEFCLLMWVWIVFWGNAFIVRQRDHVIFDLLYTQVNAGVRKWFAIFGALGIAVGLAISLEPTWDKFYILRLKKTPTLSSIFGNDIRVLHVYSIYFLFLAVVSIRYVWRAWHSFKHGADVDLHHFDELASNQRRQSGS